MRARLPSAVLSLVVLGCSSVSERPGAADTAVPVDAAVPADAASPVDAAVSPDAASPVDGASVDAAPPTDGGGTCQTIGAEEWIAPRAVPAGGHASVLMRTSSAAGCGCVPASRLEDPGGPYVSFLACDCANEDPCIDPGYDATATAEVRGAAGTQMQFYHPYAGGRVILEVVDPTLAAPVESVDAIELVSPVSRYLTDVGRHVWVRIGGTARSCCLAPVPLVTQTGPGTLTVTNAALDACECVGSLATWETFHDLGPLPAGHYDVTANGLTVAIDVP
ncbi:MAG: hypothetical protein U0234_23150 [Sandaracinus sp.]